MPTFEEVFRTAQQLTREEQEQLQRALETLRHPDRQPSRERILGLNAGQIWMTNDFDAPLPDEYAGLRD